MERREIAAWTAFCALVEPYTPEAARAKTLAGRAAQAAAQCGTIEKNGDSRACRAWIPERLAAYAAWLAARAEDHLGRRNLSALRESETAKILAAFTEDAERRACDAIGAGMRMTPGEAAAYAEEIAIGAIEIGERAGSVRARVALDAEERAIGERVALLERWAANPHGESETLAALCGLTPF